jgi:hypothetical protein
MILSYLPGVERSHPPAMQSCQLAAAEDGRSGVSIAASRR